MIVLPANIQESRVFTEDHLQLLSNVEEIPSVDPSFVDPVLTNIVQYFSLTPDIMEEEIHAYAASLLHQGRLQEAWQVLLTTSDLV